MSDDDAEWFLIMDENFRQITDANYVTAMQAKILKRDAITADPFIRIAVKVSYSPKKAI